MEPEAISVFDPKPALRVKASYDRIAPHYDGTLRLLERLAFRRWRRRLWDKLQCPGRVLEVGVGTGASFFHYPPGARVQALDISLSMLERARLRAQLRPVGGAKVDLMGMDAQTLAFPQDTFDAVVSSLVFCSVPDPLRGLREVRRVLKPGGQFLLLEHVRSRPPLGWAMDILNPLTKRLGGENINRDTLGNLRRAGFQIKAVERLFWDIFLLIEAR